MSDDHTPRARLESLKREAKRWLRALRAGDPAATARLARALAAPPAEPTLRDVQLALAREHGCAGWTALVEEVERASAAREATRVSLARYETMADALLEAYRTGTPEALERHYRYTWHRRPLDGMRRYVLLDLGKLPLDTQRADGIDITRDDARHLVAREHGFASWDALRAFTAEMPRARRLAGKPVRLTVPVEGDDPHTILASRDWDAVLERLAERPEATLEAEGEMTDEVLADVARIPGVRALRLSSSRALTDEGVRALAGLASLRKLDLSQTAVTDRGIAALGGLHALEALSLAMTHATDAGVAALGACDALRSVNLSWTRTGDGALRALAGKPALGTLHTGAGVTADGLAALRDYPAFATWRHERPAIRLLDAGAAPTMLVPRGPFGDAGLRHLRALDGLFAVNLDARELGLTPAALAPLAAMTHLGWLSVDATDAWMPGLARMPHLRFLGAQDTPAGDDGFAALAQSPTLEMIWGRRCHNLGARGFHALSTMPALRGLSVSCLNVGDDGVAALPDFPALRELMPMDIPDDGYRHIARCERLESLFLMYCRDTTDAATEHVVRLPRLTRYFNSYTAVTDRTPALLATMPTLERVTFDQCHGLTDAGVRALARLPRLRRLKVAGKGVTETVASAFPPEVRVTIGG